MCERERDKRIERKEMRNRMFVCERKDKRKRERKGEEEEKSHRMSI